MTSPELPHPRTGQLFTSPVPPGTGWPGDPAKPDTPVAHDAGEAAHLAAGCACTDQLDAEVSACRACPRLVTWREEVAFSKRAGFRDQPYWGRPVPSLGDPAAEMLVIGLAPAAHGANRTGRMFTGDRSGDWLMVALHRAGLASRPTSVDAADGMELVNCRVVAPVHCAPPDNRPTTDEKRTCAAWFDRELSMLTNARSALCLGGIAWTSTLAAARRLGWTVPRPAPRFGHGATTILTRPDGTTLTTVGSYHVSQQNTFTGRLTRAMLDEVVLTARRAATASRATK